MVRQFTVQRKLSYIFVSLETRAHKCDQQPSILYHCVSRWSTFHQMHCVECVMCVIAKFCNNTWCVVAKLWTTRCVSLRHFTWTHCVVAKFRKYTPCVVPQFRDDMLSVVVAHNVLM